MALILASVFDHAAWPDLPKVIPKLLGEVWEFRKTTPVKAAGHNRLISS